MIPRLVMKLSIALCDLLCLESCLNMNKSFDENMKEIVGCVVVQRFVIKFI
ncbi:hypothetical protein SAMN05421764_11191 [Donghicola eburneus]|nr:hypothetical protein SAMN05421764_11191 [Donghicola eburneus]